MTHGPGVEEREEREERELVCAIRALEGELVAAPARDEQARLHGELKAARARLAALYLRWPGARGRHTARPDARRARN